MTIVARWECGAHWVVLQVSAGRYSYVGRWCGILEPMASESEAVAAMQAKVDSGYFLPDDVKLPMRRIV